MNYSKCLLLPLQILGRLVTWGLSFVFPCPRIGNRAHSRQPWTDSPASNIEIRLECNYLKTGVAVRFLCHLLYRYKKNECLHNSATSGCILAQSWHILRVTSRQPQLLWCSEAARAVDTLSPFFKLWNALNIMIHDVQLRLKVWFSWTQGSHFQKIRWTFRIQPASPLPHVFRDHGKA
jgi:hypothetical protein